MATSGSTSVAVTSYDSLKFVWTQVSQSIPNNTTTISWMLQLVSIANGKIESTAPKAWSVTVNGTPYSGTNYIGIADNSSKTLASGTTTIAHNSDGAKSFSYSFSQEFGIVFAGASVGTKSGSGSGVLNTIPRATTPTLHSYSVDMGGTVTIYTYAASTAFTHDLAYAFAGSDFVTFATGVGSAYYWALPLSLADRIPNATSGTLTIRCTTKNGSTVVGTATVLMTAKVPASVVPTISAVSVSEATTGIAAQFGAYIQTKSKLAVAITAEGARGSTIKSYSTMLLGKTYTGASWTSGILAQSGSLSLVTTVTDSRGRTTQETTVVSVLAYTPPQIVAFHVARYDASGNPDPDGNRLWATYAYSVALLGDKNTASMKIEYKRSTATSWSQLLTSTALSANTTAKPSTTFSTDYQYDLRIMVTDWFGASATYGAILPSGAVILDIRADGKGLAFFKTSTKEGVEIAGELPGSAIALTTSADLDDLTKPGFYAIQSTTISATIANKPYTDNATASIKVEDTGGGTVRQVLQKSTKTDGAIYERGYSSGSWGDWSLVYSGASKVLWSGSQLMTASQSVTFNEPLSQQQSGIVLVFSRYISNEAQNYYYSCHFVPKQLIQTTPSSSVTFTMMTAKFEYLTGKYLIITDTGLTGNDWNDDTGTSNGITFNNGQFALRFVIGV